MKLDTQAKPWLAASKDVTRPVLQNVKIDPDGTAWASNGYIAVKIPGFVQSEDGETPTEKPVLYQAEHLSGLLKQSDKWWDKWGGCPVEKDGTSLKLLRTKTGAPAVILETEMDPQEYPRMTSVWTGPQVPGERRFKIAFNPKRLLDLALALGWNGKEPQGIEIEIPLEGNKVNGKAWRVWISGLPGEGIFMPCRPEGWKEDDDHKFVHGGVVELEKEKTE